MRPDLPVRPAPPFGAVAARPRRPRVVRLLLLALVGVAVLSALAVPARPLLVHRASLALGRTRLLPGAEGPGGYAVAGLPPAASYALDVRNDGPAPVLVTGLADPVVGPYAASPGRGGPGGGLPERPGFAPFRLWPGQARLVVVHLALTGAPPAPVTVTTLRLATRVLGTDRVLAVALPVPLTLG